MDKRGFKKMFLIVIAVIVIVLLVIYLVVTPRTRESLEKIAQPEAAETIATQGQQANQSKLVKNNAQNKPSQTQQKSLSTKQIAALDSELLPRQYHSDLYLEAYSLISEKFLCFIYDFAPNIKSNLRASFAASDRQSQLDDIINQCQKELKNYPLLAQKGEDLSRTIEPSSQLGRLIKQGDQNTSLNEQSKDLKYQSLLAVLKSKNGPLIAAQASTPYLYFSEGEIIPISLWVDSQDNQYIEQLFQLAMTQLACRYQGGIACQPQSMVMIMNCLSHQPACGLDFDDYYQQTIMPGMQKDVDILIEKFEAMADSK